MPSSVNVNGKTIYIPGIYGFVDASALAGKGISTGNVAVVGDFPSMEQNALNWFTSPQALRNWDKNDLKLARLAKLLFAPAVDDAVSGANAVLLVNAGANTQASYTFKDSAPADSLVVKAKKWGTKGNQVFFQMVSNAADTSLLDISIAEPGATETYTGVGSGNLLQFQLDATICTEMRSADSVSALLSLAVADKLDWAFTCYICDPATGVNDALPLNAAPVVTRLWPNMAVTGPLSAVLTKVVQPGGTATVTVVGKDSVGASVTGVASFAAGEGLVGKTVDLAGNPVSWSEVQSVTLDTAGAEPLGNTYVSLEGKAFSWTLSELTYITDVVTLVSGYATKGWVATTLLPLAARVPATDIDKKVDITVISPGSAYLRADLWAILDKLSTSNIVEASRATGANMPPSPWGLVAGSTVAQNLLGGTTSAPTPTTYEDAFAEIETADVQWVVPLSTNIAVLKAARQHCINAAIVGHERAAFGGATKNTSLANLLANYTSALNSRHIAVCAQEIQITGPLGTAEWLTPEYMAVQLAGMKAGTTVGEPLTNKKPDVLDMRSSWTAQKDDNEVISKGILAYTKGGIGIKVLRSISTWLTDDNAAYVEVSTNQSVNTSIRSLRANLESSVGKKANIPINIFKQNVESLLRKQVTDGIITAFRNVVITRVVDKYRIDYDLAPVFPFNFAEIWAHVGDFEF